MTDMATRRALLGAGFIGVLGALGACTSPSGPAPTPSSRDTGTPTASTEPTPTPTPTPTTRPDPLPAGIVNALIIGTDSRDPKSLGGNADAIVVAQLSADRRSLALVSIARDTYVSIRNKKGKINSAFPSGGMPLLREAVSDLFGGLPIHLTAQANFNNFIALTRWLGGIRVQNQHRTRTTVISTGRVVEFPEGEILLENTDGLIYARERKTMPLGDLDRAERHRALVTGMLRGLQAVATQRPDEFGPLVQNLAGNVKVTDFDMAAVGDLGTPLKQLDLASVTSLMVPIQRFGSVNGASVNFVDEPQLAALAEGLRAGDLTAYVAAHGTDYKPG